MIDAHRIIRIHDRATHLWHDNAPHFATGDTPASHEQLEQHFKDPLDDPSGDPLLPLDGLMVTILAQHRANFDLWHQEDLARDMSATAENIATVKHAIDRLNQDRNDLVEKIDETLLCSLPAQNSTAPLNSEPPGLIIDRLSILALKIYHTDEEAHRQTAADSDAHRIRNLNRLAVLKEQRADLADCLDNLWHQVLAGQRRFKLYRQMKMYNDPQLNPVLYGQPGIRKGC